MTLTGTKYQYQRRLGGGGMAEVFLASTVGAEGFTRPIAIKRVLPSYSQDADFAAMFINEARLSSLLRHPNIVQVLDFDRDADQSLYLVMELVEGKDLADILNTGLLPLPVIVHVIREVLTGLAHAHEMTTPEGKPLGIVHRDISPHNVLVSWDGVVKVSDFGIAKAMAASGAVASGTIKGKPLYMAPEQVTMPDHLDHRADLFAVGVMLYEMLTGTRVYRGATHQEVITDVLQVANGWRRLETPRRLNPEVPQDVCDVTVMLLAIHRDDRFSHARDAIDALSATTSASPHGAEMLATVLSERFPAEAPRRRRRRGGVPGVRTGPTGATWAGPLPSAMPAGTPQAAMSVETRTAVPRGGRASRRVVAGVVGGLLLVFAAILMSTLRGRPSSRPPATDPSNHAAASLDASTSASPDAAPFLPAVDAAAATTTAADAAPSMPDARPSRRSSGHRPRKDPGGSTIHDVPIENDQ